MFSVIANVHGFSGITSHFDHSTWPPHGNILSFAIVVIFMCFNFQDSYIGYFQWKEALNTAGPVESLVTPLSCMAYQCRPDISMLCLYHTATTANVNFPLQFVVRCRHVDFLLSAPCTHTRKLRLLSPFVTETSSAVAKRPCDCCLSGSVLAKI